MTANLVADADIIFLPCGFLIISFFFLSLPNLSRRRLDVYHTSTHAMVWPYCEFRMHVWNVLHATHWKYRTQKIAKSSPSAHHRTILSGYILATTAHIDNRKNLLSINISSRCPHNMVNFDLLAAEISPVVWGTPANFNGFRVLAALLHGTPAVGVSQTFQRWTEGATYIRQGGHHVGHRPTF